MSVFASIAEPKALWYATRGTGVVSLVLLVPGIKVIEDVMHEPKNFLNHRQVVCVKCVNSHLTERVLIDLNIVSSSDSC